MAESRFVTTRGAGDAKWGPVLSTRLTHNSTHQTGPDSIGISCSLGCDGTVLSTESNIIWAEKIGVYADRDYPDNRDLFWNSVGKPALTEPGISPTVRIADPRFTAPASGDLRLRDGSPAVDRGSLESAWSVDAYGMPLPQGAAVDIGAAERG